MSRLKDRKVLAVVVVLALVTTVVVVQYLSTPPRCGPSQLTDKGEPFCIPTPEMVFNPRYLTRTNDSYILHINVSNLYWPYPVNLTQATFNGSSLTSFWPSACYIGTAPPFSLRPNESTLFQVVFSDFQGKPAFNSGDVLNLTVIFDKNRSLAEYLIAVP